MGTPGDLVRPRIGGPGGRVAGHVPQRRVSDAHHSTACGDAGGAFLPGQFQNLPGAAKRELRPLQPAGVLLGRSAQPWGPCAATTLV